MAGSPFIKNYDNRPLFYNANDVITANWLPHRPPRYTMPRATSCRDAVRMRQFDAHHGAIYIATSRDDHLPQSIQTSNANPRLAAMPANRSIRNAILPTHTEWTTTAIGSPLATHTNFAAVFTGIHALEKPPGCRLEERNRVSKRPVKNQPTACSIG